MSTNVTEELLTNLREAKAAAQSAFALLAQRVADGEEVDTQEASAIINAAGKEAGDLATAVAGLQRIEELKAIVATKPEVERQQSAQLAKLGEEMKADDALLLEVQRRISTRAETARMQMLGAKPMDAIADAERELKLLTNPIPPQQPARKSAPWGS
jgi:hypothetical protein